MCVVFTNLYCTRAMEITIKTPKDLGILDNEKQASNSSSSSSFFFFNTHIRFFLSLHV